MIKSSRWARNRGKPGDGQCWCGWFGFCGLFCGSCGDCRAGFTLTYRCKAAPASCVKALRGSRAAPNQREEEEARPQPRNGEPWAEAGAVLPLQGPQGSGSQPRKGRTPGPAAIFTLSPPVSSSPSPCQLSFPILFFNFL